MKDYCLILFILISFAISQEETNDKDETRGCVISEKEGICCWRNSNRCCAPPKEDVMCAQAFTNCCKIKTYNEETNTSEYKYELESEIQKITIDENHIKIIKFNLLLFILILL